MTPAFQTSDFRTRYGYIKRHTTYNNLYSVTVEDGDGDSYDFEVEAKDSREAARIAELKAADEGCYNVINMFIYAI